ncbi:MAG TPA: IS200/IS605 family transposase [Caldithrix abyssi]|uniref:IS200/IS605 family transposase n=1 Tax=Caldithrix abyssi TaxID=187145 RepID=A0A7V5H1T4_CALAY|nr:IS200/IS605 family transposase [Caldisericaceae bacterium]HHE54264.1 IS200/IS605 family transposase [Caldithrix abyssi]
MAEHSFVRCWLHLLWGTLDYQKVLTEEARRKLSKYFYQYAKDKGIYMKINHVNPDHVHALIELPSKMTIEDLFHLFKGSSSHWINQNSIVEKKFAWEKGYAAFSVSHSKLDQVIKFIAEQEQRHWNMTFEQELNELIKRHELITVEKGKTV